MVALFDAAPTRYQLAFEPAEVDDLKARLANARWPAEDVVPDVSDHRLGPKLAWMKQMAAKWQEFSFDGLLADSNEFNHFLVSIEDVKIHYLHAVSPHKNARACMLLHGWPGSHLEFLPAIKELTNPSTEGKQAYHLVMPTMPGYPLSGPVPTKNWTMTDTARLFNKLMLGLGYEEYGAQGGDWGSITARHLGALHKANCKAVHLNFCPAPPPAPLSWVPPRFFLNYAGFLMSGLERKRTEKALQYLENEMAYYQMQATKPATLGYAMTDSPVAWLSWIGDKFTFWMAEGDHFDPDVVSPIELAVLRTCSLYWLTRQIHTSFLPYALNEDFLALILKRELWLPNFAMSVFPDEIASTPRQFVERTGKCRWWRDAEKGGHFPALESTDEYIEHVRDAFETIWK